MNAHPTFTSHIINWYQTNRRDLPWRNTKNPYFIWLSEIILQQTRVEQGMSYYLAFQEQYPTVFDLANAPEEDVLRLWQGLGYYSRARNLHFTAKKIAFEMNGIFPSTYEELKKLKGVGEYTAAAIASFCFGETKAVVDGNVFRVLARYFGIGTDIASNTGKKEFTALANDIIPQKKPALFNQAIMEFGALHCTPKSPNCLECGLAASCHAFSNKMVNQLPVKIKKVKVKQRHFIYLVYQKDSQLLMRERVDKDIWQGLNDFPLIEVDSTPNWEDENLLAKIKSYANSEGLNFKITPKIYKHVLTHQRLFASFLIIDVKNQPNILNTRSLNLEEINAIPKPVLIDNFLKDYYF